MIFLAFVGLSIVYLPGFSYGDLYPGKLRKKTFRVYLQKHSGALLSGPGGQAMRVMGNPFGVWPAGADKELESASNGRKE